MWGDCMAIAYWDFKHFEYGINYSSYFILKYKNKYFYADDYSFFNWYTLECYIWRMFQFFSIKQYKIDNTFVGDIWEDIEIIDEDSSWQYGWNKTLQAVRNYNNEIKTNFESLNENYQMEKRKGKAIQYISYEHFLEMAFRTHIVKHFVFKYKDKTYEIKYGTFKSEFNEIEPKRKHY